MFPFLPLGQLWVQWWDSFVGGELGRHQEMVTATQGGWAAIDLGQQKAGHSLTEQPIARHPVKLQESKSLACSGLGDLPTPNASDRMGDPGSEAQSWELSMCYVAFETLMESKTVAIYSMV